MAVKTQMMHEGRLYYSISAAVKLLGTNTTKLKLESCGVYGHCKITDNLRDLGERCGKHRVYANGLSPVEF